MLGKNNHTASKATKIHKHDAYDELVMEENISEGKEFSETMYDDDRFEDSEMDTREDDEDERCNYENYATVTSENDERSKEKMKRDQLIQRRNAYAEKARMRNSHNAYIAECELLRKSKDSEKKTENFLTRGRSLQPILIHRSESNSPRIRDPSPSITRLYNNGVTKLRAEYAQSLERKKSCNGHGDSEKLKRLVATSKMVSRPKADSLYARGVEKLRHQRASIERTRQEDVLEAKKKDEKLQKLVSRPVPLSPSALRLYSKGVAKLRAQSVERMREIDASDSVKQLEKLKNLVSNVQAIPTADRLYHHGVAKLRAHSAERIRAMHSDSVETQPSHNIFKNAGKLYNCGVSNPRAQSVERNRLIEAVDEKKQMKNLERLDSNKETLSRNPESLYIETVQEDFERADPALIEHRPSSRKGRVMNTL